MKEKTADKWLPIQSVAETLGCTDQYIYQLIRQGDLRAMKLGERALRISERSLQDFIATRAVNPEDYYAPAEPQHKIPQADHPPPTTVARSKWMNR